MGPNQRRPHSATDCLCFRVGVWIYADSWDGIGGRQLNITDCEVLAASVDENCAFDMESVRNFTRESVALNRDYTIAFWVRPVSMPSYGSDAQHSVHIGVVWLLIMCSSRC